MGKILRWIGIILGALVLVLLVAGGVIYFRGQSRLGNGHDVTPDSIAIPTDEAALARGEHIVTAISGCVGCHTENLGGQVLIDDPSFAVVAAPNLTSGQGGIGATYTDADWVRAIRHGVAANGRALFVMPSHWLWYMTDEDLGAMIAYLKSVPPVDNTLPPRRFSLMATMLAGAGVLPLEPDLIAQNDSRPAVTPGVTVEYGEYISRIASCRDCHGVDLAGGADPNAPHGPNLTPGGAFAAYQESDFLTLMRTGATPGGRTVSEEMPWKEYGRMTDEELQALFQYLKSLPALPNAGS